MAHRHAVHNPLAMFRRAITLEDYRAVLAVSPPLGQFDVAPMVGRCGGSGADPCDLLPPFNGRPTVAVVGSAVATAALALHDQPDPLAFPAAAASVQKAMAQAGVTPDDLDLFEPHDLFSIHAALALEAAGLAEPGGGWRLPGQGVAGGDGGLPLLTFGGSKARATPAGRRACTSWPRSRCSFRGGPVRTRWRAPASAWSSAWGARGPPPPPQISGPAGAVGRRSDSS